MAHIIIIMYMHHVLYTYWLSDYIAKIGNNPWDKESHYNAEDFIPIEMWPL